MKPTLLEVQGSFAVPFRWWSARAVLGWALERFGGRLGIASCFSIEDCVVIDIAHTIKPECACSRSTPVGCRTRRT